MRETGIRLLITAGAALLIICMFTTAGLKAQQTKIYQLQGSVRDSVYEAVANATIRLAKSNDTLYTVTDEKGAFSFVNLAGGSYSIVISSIGYRPQGFTITLSGAVKQYRLAPVILAARVENLREVIVKHKAVPVRVKTDTVEYNAGSYAVRTNDMAADLIRQLPGIEVDDNDNVTMLNKQVMKLRVNGKDFFTNDVREYISQIPAAIIDKIQVIDDYGDEANFTGMKHAEPAKMLNIVMKNNINNGIFGNADLTGGTDGRGQLNTAANLWEDVKQLGLTAGGAVIKNSYELQEKGAAAFTVRDELRKGVSASLNYNYNYLNNTVNQTDVTEQETALGKLYNSGTNTERKRSNTHNINANLQAVTDKGYLQAGITSNLYNGERNLSQQNSFTGVLNQQNYTESHAPNDGSITTVNMVYARRQPEGSNSYTIALNGNYSVNNTSEVLDNYYLPGAINLVNPNYNYQKRDVSLNGNTLQANGEFKYRYNIKGLSDSVTKSNIEFGYNFNLIHSSNDFKTQLLAGADSETGTDSLKSLYRSTYITNNIGLYYIYKNKRLSYNLGLNVVPAVMITKASQLPDALTRSQINFSPAAKLNYIMPENKTLTFSYSGTSYSPSVYQLQPVADMRDPQNTVIGNPALKPAFKHTVGANFTYSSLQTASSFFATINSATVQNLVTTNIFIKPYSDNSGVLQETRYVNTNNNYQLSGTLNFTQPLMDNRLQLGAVTEGGLYKTAYFLNDIQSYNKRLNYIQTLSARLEQKFYALYASGVYNYNSSRYTIQQGTLRSLDYLQLSLAASLNLPQLVVLEANATKTRYLSNYFINAYNPLVINASIRRNLFKNNAGQISIQAYDLLNQMQNLTRTTTETAVTDIRVNRVTRYVMVNFILKLNRFGK